MWSAFLPLQKSHSSGLKRDYARGPFFQKSGKKSVLGVSCWPCSFSPRDSRIPDFGVWQNILVLRTRTLRVSPHAPILNQTLPRPPPPPAAPPHPAATPQQNGKDHYRLMRHESCLTATSELRTGIGSSSPGWATGLRCGQSTGPRAASVGAPRSQWQ
jgi:hypothetical protein